MTMDMLKMENPSPGVRLTDSRWLAFGADDGQ